MKRTQVVVVSLVVGMVGHALADEPPPAPEPASEAPPPSPAAAAAAGQPPEERSSSLKPKPLEPPPPNHTFEAEPLRDGAIILLSVTFAGLLDAINSTGEVHPQQISPDFNTDSLLFFDRIAVTQTIDPNASTYSNLGLFAAIGFAVADPILTGYREGNVQAAIVDGVIYAEALSITWGMTNLAKIAVRRPRPIEYIEVLQHKGDPNFMVSGTDASQSFFSGHASATATVAATATYLAFARSPNTARPWITLAVGTAMTAFVGYERVRAGAHFPSDVIAGAVAGAGIGVLVTHFHRSDSDKQRPMWIGYAPETAGDGGVLALSGRF